LSRSGFVLCADGKDEVEEARLAHAINAAGHDRETTAKRLSGYRKDIGFAPGLFITIDMSPKRAAWFNRVLARLNCG